VSPEIPKVHTSIKYSETGSYTSQKKACRRLDVFFINLGFAFDVVVLFSFLRLAAVHSFGTGYITPLNQ